MESASESVNSPHRGGQQQDHRGGRHAGGLNVHYHDVGAGEPVLFLHSYGPGTTAWITFHKTVGVRNEARTNPGQGTPKLPYWHAIPTPIVDAQSASALRRSHKQQNRWEAVLT